VIAAYQDLLQRDAPTVADVRLIAPMPDQDLWMVAFVHREESIWTT